MAGDHKKLFRKIFWGSGGFHQVVLNIGQRIFLAGSVNTAIADFLHIILKKAKYISN
jgi:hypothetical protein